MGLFSTKIEEEIVAVLDISSGIVSGAIVLKNKKALPFILATATKTFRIRPDRTHQDMLEAVNHVCAELQKNTQIKPSKIYCILSVPWSHGELRSVHITREKEFQFTEVFAQKIINNEVLKFQKENQNPSQIIDKKITKVSLNGYTVKSPHGQKTHSVSLDVFLSVAPITLVEAIQDKIHTTFKSKILFTSQMLADFIVARDTLSLSKEFMVLNVGAVMTEVLVSHNDCLAGTAFFPQGIHTIIGAVATKLQKSERETESLFRLSVNRSLEESRTSSLEKAMTLAGDMWLSSFKQILLEMFPNRHIPHQIFLVAPAEFSPWMADRLSRRFFPEFTFGNVDFDVIIADTKTLYDFYNKAEHVKPDPTIIVTSLYINHI